MLVSRATGAVLSSTTQAGFDLAFAGDNL